MGKLACVFFSGEPLKEYSHNGMTFPVFLRTILQQVYYESLGFYNNVFGAWFIRKRWIARHRKMMEEIDAYNSLIHMLIEERKKNPNKKPCLLNKLLEQQKTDPKNAMNDEVLAHNFTTMILAGTGTSGNTLTQAFYYMARQPEIYQKAREEVLRVCGSEGEPTLDQLNKLDYLTAVLKEALRLGNPAH
mmetsp:Transcript_11253/g.9640  ORF Transcript_11253/g.9640 Transcript_11253/m.9640 type:complete len:189 (-) Transcript_11253:297-863(-)